MVGRFPKKVSWMFKGKMFWGLSPKTNIKSFFKKSFKLTLITGKTRKRRVSDSKLWPLASDDWESSHFLFYSFISKNNYLQNGIE